MPIVRRPRGMVDKPGPSRTITIKNKSVIAKLQALRDRIRSTLHARADSRIREKARIAMRGGYKSDPMDKSRAIRPKNESRSFQVGQILASYR